VTAQRSAESARCVFRSTHGWPIPGPAGENHLGFGGAALITSTAAQSKVCSSFGVFAHRAIVLAAVFVFAAAVSPAAPPQNHTAVATASSPSHSYLFSASLNLNTLEETIEDHSAAAQAQDPAQQPTGVIDRIEFLGNRRVRSDTLKARIFSREGDTYNEETLRRDFQALWNTQFFEDVKLRVEDSPDKANGKIVIFDVKERPQIRRIRYDGMHSISESDILDRFKERKVQLSVESQFDPTKIKKAEVVIKDLLGEHGRQFAKVTPQYERIASSNAVILVFKIDEGPKVKVGQVHFKGNHAFSDRKLLRSMHNDRPYAIPLYLFEIPVLTKTYDRQKLSEDLEVGVRGLYQDNGYFKASIGEPILENIDKTSNKLGVPVPFVGKSAGKAVNITIPIEEGEQFHMGTLKIVSADPDKALSLKVDALKNIFPLKKGDVFAADKVRKALKSYGDAYGEFGFIDFTPEPEFDIDASAKLINLTLKFDEQKQYYVRRIDFSGNTTTRDKVIRRELLIDEGQLFNKRAWEVSILRLNQLDYFDKIEADKAVEIKRNTKEGTVDLNVKLKEKGKQSIGLQGGVSGLAGSFIGLTYQTNNFLGLGETLTFSAQFGDLSRSFQFGFTEPYLFDRPISSGFTIFTSKYKFDQAKQEALLLGQSVSINPQFIQNYNQDSTGFTIFASYPVRRFSFTRIGLSYGITRTNITAFNDASKLLFEDVQFRSIAGPSALNGILSSTVTPTINYNTVNNPMNPTQGKSYYYSLAFAGLGGNVHTITNVFDTKYYKAVRKKKNIIGLHGTVAYINGYSGDGVPPFSRFYMGGENDIRGFDVRSISPVTYLPERTATNIFFNNPLRGNTSVSIPVLTYVATLPGADLQTYGNFEYRIPIAGPVTMAFFFDGGTDGIVQHSGLRLSPTGVTDLQTNFPGANITNSNLPIQSGTNFRFRASTGIEFVVQLPIIQAPFRIYYAYNVNRLHEQLIAPSPFINQSDKDFLHSTLDPLDPSNHNLIDSQLNFILQNPGRLNYFEPKTTFRFTVSRTF
jgi:outer membrane protein insertion porin family